jgi:hypothetical protein
MYFYEFESFFLRLGLDWIGLDWAGLDSARYCACMVWRLLVWENSLALLGPRFPFKEWDGMGWARGDR